MRLFERHLGRDTAVTAITFIAGIALSASPAGAVDFTNACRNSAVPSNWDQVNVSQTATTSPSSVSPGDTVALNDISQTVSVPGAIFVAGYNLGILPAGPNTVPATLHSVIDGTNTIPAQQTTNSVDTTITTTISDPDGTPGTGDESATDGSATVTYAPETWTAAALGPISFREHTDPAITGVAGGGIIAVAHISISGGTLNVQFHCSPGTVAGSNPGVPAFIDPAPPFAAADSVPPPPPTAPPANTALPTISGTARKGEALAALPGTWTNNPTSIAFQWQDCDADGSSCVNIAGATENPYTLATSDIGHAVRVVVTATNAVGSTKATSGPTARVAAAANAPTLTSVRLARRSFLARAGTTLSMDLSAAATVRAVISRKARGRNVNGRCKAKAKTGKRCTLMATAGRQSFRGAEGTNRFKLVTRRLKPGSYTLTLTAVAAGETSEAVTLRFTIVRPKSGGH
jgi:hypothetical protein